MFVFYAVYILKAYIFKGDDKEYTSERIKNFIKISYVIKENKTK